MARDILTEVTSMGDDSGSAGARPVTWWDQYAAKGLRSLSTTARSVLETDSRTIVSGCIPGPGAADAWPASRVRTGVVVGAVQSGKTGSMIAVAALMLDAGVDVLVILAGSRVALWHQTYDRLLKQLDGTTPEKSTERWARRLLVPNPFTTFLGEVRSTPKQYMASASAGIVSALKERRPIILVIPKIDAHLLAVSRELHSCIQRVQGALPQPLHMVVIDDEADDASVLDAADSKTIPRRIEMLWAGDRLHGQTASPKLYATYVAYTATPQANFLQQSHNPLAPRSFCVALRAPYKTGTTTPRSATFGEPAGIRGYYCGGELFYNELRSPREASLCRSTPFPKPEDAIDEADHERRVRAASDEMLLEGLRAYLVAAGIRTFVAKSAGKLLPSEMTGALLEADGARLPPPTSMLVHPSARKDLHLDEARRLILLSAGLDPDDPRHDARGRRHEDLALDVEALRSSLHQDDQEWRRWVDAYRATLHAMSTWPG